MNSVSLTGIIAALALVIVGAAIGGYLIGRRGFQANDADTEPADFPLLAATVLELFGSAGLLLDGKNQVVGSNKQAAAMALVSKGLLVHSELIDLVGSARRSNRVERLKGKLQIGVQSTKRAVRARAAQVGEDFVLLVIEDQTKQVRAAQLRRDFIENISHELKTPIGAISLLAEAIAGSGDDAKALRKFTGQLSAESDRLASLVQDIIALSRLQSEDLIADAQLVNLSQVISEAVSRNQLLAESKNINLEVDEASDLQVFGNKEMLVTALKNLIENAITYSESKSKIGIGMRAKGRAAEISVADNGVGISEADQKRVFERFYRVDPSRSRETGGTGLGLSIVKHAVAAHRGEVKVFSKLGVGSTFTMRLPLAKSSKSKKGTITLIAEDA